MVTGLSKSFDHKEPFEFESDNETAEVEIDLRLSMQEKLARAIDKEINSKTKFQVTNNERCNEYCEKELAIFEVEGKRGANLIPPGSVEPERVFSGCERTVTKITSSLHAESVMDMLTFLREYF
jgi:hypothetical protein